MRRDTPADATASRRFHNGPRPSSDVARRLAPHYSPRGVRSGPRSASRDGGRVRPDNAGRTNPSVSPNRLADNRVTAPMRLRDYLDASGRGTADLNRNRYRLGQARPLAHRQPVQLPRDNRWARGHSVWRPDFQTSRYRSSHYSPNFIYAMNYAYRPTAWGTRPWWGTKHHHTWHKGRWDYGWNNHWRNRYRHYHRPVSYYPPGYRSYYVGPAAIIPWGLASWSLGSLAYDIGYYSYRNPYYAPPVETYTTVINYSEPITVAATRYEPATEAIALSNAEKSAVALQLSRATFQEGDYLAALSAVDEAISYEPGDSTLHEYRALVLFALGRYGDAAGVLNPVLASGPGWDWETMIGLYASADRYTDQLRRLEDYVLNQADQADAHFLLGYHYMVGGHLEDAYAMFDRVHQLQPGDTVARQLRSLLADSIPSEEPLLEKTDATEVAKAEKPSLDKAALQGVWEATSAEGKVITLSMADLDSFSWKYEGANDSEVLQGDWSIDEEGFLVLAGKDVQLVGDITLNEDGSLHFLLAGSPEGDPGLVFRRN